LKWWPFRWHKLPLKMSKTELQVALAAATETNKRTAGVFLDTLSDIAYKAMKKNGEFVWPGFGKLVKQKRKARIGINPKTQHEIKIPAKTVVKIPSRQGGKGRGSRSEKVVSRVVSGICTIVLSPAVTDSFHS
jgi:DNA-binding protein HU-beta